MVLRIILITLLATWSGATAVARPHPVVAQLPHITSYALNSPLACPRGVQEVRRRQFWSEWAQGGAPNSLAVLKSAVPATVRRRRYSDDSLSQAPKIQEVVSLKTRRLAEHIKSRISPPPKGQTGFYYGFTVDMVGASTIPKPKPKSAETILLERVLSEMDVLRKDLEVLKQKLGADVPALPSQIDSLELTQEEIETFYNEIGDKAEEWAFQMMQEDTDQGWTEVSCNRAVRKTFNPNGTTQTFLKWMKDSRGEENVNPKDDRNFPCLKITGIIDAPLDAVCLYLSKEENTADYNELVERNEDLQEVSPSSKICFGQTPQILLIQPRTLITYCKHKWLSDGSQLVVNQACRHPKKLTKQNMGKFDPAVDLLDDKKRHMAFALRGANLIGRDPSDPDNKTRITILAHGSPGRDVPTWAMEMAVKSLGNIEPYRLFYLINQNVQKKLPRLQQELEEQQDQAQLVSERSDGRTTRPAGIAQLGYACFWPKGGGRLDHKKAAPLLMPLDNNKPVFEDERGETDSSTAESSPAPVPSTAAAPEPTTKSLSEPELANAL